MWSVVRKRNMRSILPERIEVKVSLLSKFLYRWRGVIGGIFFLVLLPFSSPQVMIFPQAPLNRGFHPFTPLGKNQIGFASLIIGMTLRFWARGYIGRESDSRVFSLPEVITSSIYWLRHPLYLANFFLVLGVMLFLNPPKVMAYACLFGFGLEYGLFVLSEERLRKNGKEVKRRWSFSSALLELRTALILGLIFVLLPSGGLSVYGAGFSPQDKGFHRKRDSL